MRNRNFIIWIEILILLASGGCGTMPLPDTPTPTSTSIPTSTPTPTSTSIPTSTPTLAPTFTPLCSGWCDIFSQIGNGAAFLESLDTKDLTYELSEECKHAGETGVKLDYDISYIEGGKNDRSWGLHWKDTSFKYFDADQFTALTFWVRGAKGGEVFQIGLKDSDGSEVTLRLDKDLGLKVTCEWQEVRINLTKFDYQGVKIDSPYRIENLAFIFETDGSEISGSICIDDIAFVK